MKVQKTQIEAVHKINAEYIFLDRTLLGYYAMFEQTGAKIDTRFAKEVVGVRAETISNPNKKHYKSVFQSKKVF